MTLRVPFEDFSAAVNRHFKTRDVYVHGIGRRTLATCSEAGTVIISSVAMSPPVVTSELHQAGLHCHSGLWSVDDDAEVLSLPCIGIVSYRANKEKTAVWAEVYRSEPTVGIVLEDFAYEMITETGMAGMPQNDFLTACQASAFVLTASQIELLMAEKDA